MSDGGFCHDEAEPKEPCDGNGECFRLSADISRLEAENARLREERDVYERRWRDIYDIPLARLQLPDGSVPGGTVECAEAWHRIARERGAKLSALIASVREIADRLNSDSGDACTMYNGSGTKCETCGEWFSKHASRKLEQSLLSALQQAIGDTQ